MSFQRRYLAPLPPRANRIRGLALCLIAVCSNAMASAGIVLINKTESITLGSVVSPTTYPSPYSDENYHGAASASLNSAVATATRRQNTGATFGAHAAAVVAVTDGFLKVASSHTIGGGSMYTLSNGTHVLSASAVLGAGMGNQVTSVISWGFNELPGERPEREIIDGTDPDEWLRQSEEDGNVPADRTEDDAMAYQLYNLPIVDSYGHSDFIYVSARGYDRPITATNPLSLVTDDAFFSVHIPEGAGGSGSFQISFADQTHTVSAGDTLDFGDFTSGEVYRFRIWPTESDELVPLAADELNVLGFRFVNEGPTVLLQSQIIPEPSTYALATLGLTTLVAYGYRRKRR